MTDKLLTKSLVIQNANDLKDTSGRFYENSASKKTDLAQSHLLKTGPSTKSVLINNENSLSVTETKFKTTKGQSISYVNVDIKTVTMSAHKPTTPDDKKWHTTLGSKSAEKSNSSGFTTSLVKEKANQGYKPHSLNRPSAKDMERVKGFASPVKSNTKNTDLKDVTEVNESRNEFATPVKKNKFNNPSETTRTEKSPSEYPTYGRCKSPRQQAGNKTENSGKKDLELSGSATKKAALPSLEVYNELPNQMFTVSVSKINPQQQAQKTPSNLVNLLHKKSAKKLNEPRSPVVDKNLLSSGKGNTENEIEDERSPEVENLSMLKTKTSPSKVIQGRVAKKVEALNKKGASSGITTPAELNEAWTIKNSLGKKDINDSVEKLDTLTVEDLDTKESPEKKTPVKVKQPKDSKQIDDVHLNITALKPEYKSPVSKATKASKLDKGLKSPLVENSAKTNNVTKSAQKAKDTAKTPKKPEKVVDKVQQDKLDAYREFLLKMSFSFDYQIKYSNESAFVPYKFYIGKGNNHMLLRQLMKGRWWWKETDSKNPKDINFMWTQWKNNKFIKAMPCINVKKLKGPSAKYFKSIAAAEENTEQPTEVQATETPVNVQGVGNHNKGIVADFYERLFNQEEIEAIKSNPDFFKSSMEVEDLEENSEPVFKKRLRQLGEMQNKRFCNHIEDNFHLSNKKCLLVNMRSYFASIGDDYSKHLPLTFHIKNGIESEEFQKFTEFYMQREKENEEKETEPKNKSNSKARNLWIVKPGENTNKGKGITLVNNLDDIKEIIGSGNKGTRTYLVQLYLDRPLLYNKRKFDIRTYMLVSCINGVYKGYWYQDGYIRTSSKEFSVKKVSDKQIHLTNDAIQKKYEEYGKYENANKVSYSEFERYLENTYNGKVNFNRDIYPQMKASAANTIKAVYGIFDPNKRENTFEVFGLDFMIDSSFRVWLIEVNTNPDITIPCPKLGILIPNMVENALKLTVDVMYPPPADLPTKKQVIPEDLLENNKFELVFDERYEGAALRKTLKQRQEELKVLSSEDPNLDDEGSDDEGGKD